MKHLDLSGFKKVGGTRKYSVFKDDQGNMIHINHASVDKEKAQDMRKLPFQRFNKGGKVRKQVAQDKGPKLDKEETKKLVEGLKGALGMNQGGMTPSRRARDLGIEGGGPMTPDVARRLAQVEPDAPELQTNAPSLTVSDEDPQNVLQAARQGADMPMDPQLEPSPAPPLEEPTAKSAAPADPYQQSIDKIRSGADAIAQANATIASEQANLARNQQSVIEETQKEMAQIDQTRNQVMGEIEGLQEKLVELENSQLQRDRVYGEMSTAGKIAAAISLIAGGINAPFTGGRNLAADALDKVIEQDIRAQEKEMANKNNVLAYNLHMLKDKDQALALRRGQMFDMMKLKLEKAAAAAQNPVAQANLAKMAAEYKMKAEQAVMPLIEAQTRERVNQQKLALQRQLSTADEVTPEQAEQFVATLPEQQARVARKELGSLRNINEGVDMAAKAFNELGKISTADYYTSMSAAANFRMQNFLIEQAMRASMKGQGALSDQDVKAMESAKVNPRDTKEIIAAKKKAFVDYLAQKRANPASQLRTMGVPLPKLPANVGFTPR